MQRYVGHAVEKDRDEEWKREGDVGQLGGGPIRKETDVPVGALDVGVDRGYEAVAPWWPFGISCAGGEAEGTVCVHLVKQKRQERQEGVEAGTKHDDWARQGRRKQKGMN